MKQGKTNVRKHNEQKRSEQFIKLKVFACDLKFFLVDKIFLYSYKNFIIYDLI
jgi:hypothetical protein